MCWRGPGGVRVLQPGLPDLLFAEILGKGAFLEEDLGDTDLFFVRGFNGRPPYSGVQLSMTDTILCLLHRLSSQNE
ncbi:hypothetical protein AMS66_29900 [Paenibacillus xylanivorans]|uniref:Uncharacterized protein n=1 Tax=Paenibacillus xylanivorans TaxID=1705561 RepID=A0A0N0C2C0_9BACL|nr:hypothetical protein AMS66_29900 [Paenibacillus xylanivorans]